MIDPTISTCAYQFNQYLQNIAREAQIRLKARLRRRVTWDKVSMIEIPVDSGGVGTGA
jgi:hypothetical protein